MWVLVSYLCNGRLSSNFGLATMGLATDSRSIARNISFASWNRSFGLVTSVGDILGWNCGLGDLCLCSALRRAPSRLLPLAVPLMIGLVVDVIARLCGFISIVGAGIERSGLQLPLRPIRGKVMLLLLGSRSTLR